MKTSESPWTTLSAEEKYDNNWINVTEYEVLNPGGGQGIYGKVSFKNKAIGIIPLDDTNHTWLVGQHRYTLNEYSWEIPEGGAPLAEDIFSAAKRELKEETGIMARRWEKIMRFHTSNSVTDEEAFVFLATELSFGPSELEETESDLVVKKLHLTEALNMVMQSQITDSMSVAGLLKVARMKGVH
ncbi:NUDIX hydrolase [Fulvivirga sp. M361]|uniref:NUDIX domain-containing protein n=1 Tax=Fulvivirga sp. M361 TaxID=2594266 RepID=UPI00117A7367|nr:NUDIX hydrolase [Fulvivirga sp. M361]TRX56278.1 NUDIX hydrolase [Fulvivirga sp. M361]